MKSLSAPAMAAIEAGEVIVTGAVEILPRVALRYTPAETFNLSAAFNGAENDVDGLAAGITVSGFDPTDTVRVSLENSNPSFVAWNYGGMVNSWLSRFNVVPDGDPDAAFKVFGTGTDEAPGYATANEAYYAFGRYDTFTGASEYTFYIHDVPAGDNAGGLRIKVERGYVSGGEPEDAICVWGGYGPIEIEGQVFQGIGDRGLVQKTGGALGGIAQGIELTLSRLEPNVIPLLDVEEVRAASVIVRRLIFASDGKTLLDFDIWDRGRVDTVSTVETIGGQATLKLGVESAARGLGRSGARMRSDSDQRLINPSDGYFRFCAYAGEKMLYWGGKKPDRIAGTTMIGDPSSGGA